MPQPTAGKAKRGIHGSFRKPGPIGIEFEELSGHHDVWEFSDYKLDPESTDWIEVFSQKGKPQRVYYRGAIVDYARPDAELKIDFSIQEVLHEPNDQSRGSTLSRLYLEFGVLEQKRGRFIAFVSKATMISVISVGRRSEFDSLAAFKPKYDEFLRLIASTGSRNAAFREFTRRYAPPTENHASSHFDGKRGKTVDHEVRHLRYSQEKAELLLENLVDEIKSEGNKSIGTKAWPRVRQIVQAMAPGWDSDQNDRFHQKIAEHDCLVMIAIYEAFALSREEARAAGNMEPLADLYKLLDYLTLELMNNIGEPIGTWGE